MQELIFSAQKHENMRERSNDAAWPEHCKRYQNYEQLERKCQYKYAGKLACKLECKL